MVERNKIVAAYRDTGRIDAQQLAPDFFFGRMQADDDDRVWVHVCLFLARKTYFAFSYAWFSHQSASCRSRSELIPNSVHFIAFSAALAETRSSPSALLSNAGGIG